MKAHGPWSTPVVLSLFAILAGVPSSGIAATPPTPTTLLIPVTGTVLDVPENIFLVGVARITSTPLATRIPGRPRVVLSIDLLAVAGQGLSTGTKYFSTGEASLTRLLVPSDLVEMTFALVPSGPAGVLSARTALASFALGFDLTTGALTAASGKLAAFQPPN
jgi:hypothetical protein